ncbi:MAG: A/G-specific adenine glycosylase [Anaerolineales bacterium]|nr:A/G-specific adenine glycosylase [Anaerolineales bacterium]
MSSSLADALLAWYRENARDLPWRRTQDPYAIWVAEVMLQQTRVETVIPYYQRWMECFPTVRDLAAADRDQVLSLWEGLGYYRRAHHLHQAAQEVVAKFDGELPCSVDELVRLPGIGKYTAAAISAIAFNQDVVPLDGNLRRVLSRLGDLEVDPRTAEGERSLVTWALDALPSGRASAFNQALMDLGATLCTPRSPVCASCPIATACLSFQRGVQAARPVRTPRRSIPHRTVTAGVLWREGKVLICRRPEGELLGGLWEFPGGTQESGESLKACLRRELVEELGIVVEPGNSLGVFNHAYTHFRITLHTFECRILSGEPQALEHSDVRWVELQSLSDYPMGKVDRQIARLIVSRDN